MPSAPALRRPALWLSLAAALVIALAASAGPAAAAPIAFKAPKLIVEAGLNGTPADFKFPTAAEVDPKSGRLFVTTQCGKVYAFNLAANGDATFAFALTAVNDYPNFGFNGTTPKPSVKGPCGDGNGNSTPDKGRQTTGLTFDPSPPAGKTILYVSHADPEIFTRQAPAANSVNPSSGVVTKFVIGGANLSTVESVTHPVTGLARSGENHSVNGMDFGPDGKLYLSIGGNTNFGGKSSYFSWFPETHLAGTVVAINTASIGAGTVDVAPYSRFAFTNTATPPATTYSVTANTNPLLPTASNNAGQVTLYANGFRNGYDLIWHSNGKLYLNENEGNGGFGSTPSTTNAPNPIAGNPDLPATGDTNCPGPAAPEPGTPPDELHLVSPNTYHGHPNPAAGNCTYEGQASGTFGGNYQAEILAYTPIAGQTHRSINALFEYDPPADPFGGELKGQLIYTSYSTTPALWRVKLNAAGTGVTAREKIANLPGALGAAMSPNGNVFATTISETGSHSGRVMAYVPDVAAGACPAPGDPSVVDSDGDGFTDAVETGAGTDPCSAASMPPDFDGDKIPDDSDPNRDGDALVDTQDQLQFDPANGSNTALPYSNGFDTAAGGGWFGSGFTGVQISSNGGPVAAKVGAGAAGGFLQMVTTNGTNRGTTNTQNNAMQIGVVPNGPLTASAFLGQPFSSSIPKGQESGGLYLGPNQDNFVQVGVHANNGSPLLELYSEVAGAGTRVASTPLVLPQESVTLFLAANPATNQVQASYKLHNGTIVPLGSVTVPAAWINATVLTGLVGTSAGGDGDRAFVFDDFSLTAGSAPPPPPGTGPIQEAAGQVVIEAEDSDARITRGGKSWSTLTGTAGFSGAGYIQSLPNTGTIVNTGFVTGAAEANYQVNFTTAGTYHVWLRQHAETTNDNSSHIALGATANTTSDRIESLTLNQWVWTKQTIDGPVATVAISAGTKALNLYMREDGTKVDRILLTTNASFTPTGAGPAASPRGSTPPPPPPAGNGGATVQAKSSGVLATSSTCCSTSAFTVDNNSTGGLQITRVTIDTANGPAMFPDIVFDPDDGTPAGDIGGVGFTVGSTPAGGTVAGSHPAGSAKDGGFTQLQIDSTGFDPGEQLSFAIDLDPTSIKGSGATNSGGHIAGVELHGATVTVQFSDGSTLTNDMVGVDPASLDSIAVLRPTVPAAPGLARQGGAASPALVTSAAQNVVVTGPAGSTGTVLAAEGHLNVDALGTGNGFDIDPFEANMAVGLTPIDFTIPAGGSVVVPVTLTNTPAGSNNPDETGLNYITAYLDGAAGAGNVSAPIVLQLDPSAPPPPPPPGTGPIQESAGQVVIEAEDSDARITRSGKSWDTLTTTAGFAGAGYIQSLANTGTIVNTGFVTTSPEANYQVAFATAGTYHVWLRQHAGTTNDNSSHIAVGGVANTTSDRIESLTLNQWVWTKATIDGPVATLAVTAGTKALNLYMREDGTKVDRILLTTDAGFTPTGVGPAASPRGSAPPPPGDTTAPAVTSRNPAAGASGVATGSAIAVTFSEAIAPATVTGSSFTLTPQGGGPAIAGAIGASAGNTTFTLTPSAALSPSTTYDVALTGAITDVAGNPLSPSTASFATAAAPPPTGPLPIANFRVDAPHPDPLLSSIFGQNSFKLRNDSPIGSGWAITRLTIDIEGAIFPDYVFDPNNEINSEGKPYTQDNGTSAGITSTGVNPPDSRKLNDGVEVGGFTRLAVDIQGLTSRAASGEPFKELKFSIDADPTSLKLTEPGEPGKIAGAELHGAPISVTFTKVGQPDVVVQSNLVKETTNQTGSASKLTPTPPAAPSIAWTGGTAPTQVSNAAQTIAVTGPPNASGALLVAEGHFDIAVAGSGAMAFDPDPFEANKLVGSTVVPFTLNGSGTANVPVTLLHTLDSDPKVLDTGLNYITGYLTNSNGPGRVSSPVVLDLEEGAPPPGDTAAPAVTSRNPAAGAADVATSTTIALTFSEAIAPATVTGSSFTLTPQGGGSPVAGAIGASAGNTTFTLTPTSALSASTTYDVGLTAAITDVAGNPLAASTASFTTAAAPPPPPPPGTGPIQESAGQVVIEAEDSDARIGRSGKSWDTLTASAGFSGAGYIQSLANTGTIVNTGFTTTAPEANYQVAFTSAGTYHVWLRQHAGTTNDNSSHVAVGAVANTTSDRIESLTLNQWVWTKQTIDGPVATVAISAGTKALNLYMREDGTKVDRILLTTNASFTPTGAGPAASPRGS